MDWLNKLCARYNFVLLAVVCAILAVLSGLYAHGVAAALGRGTAFADLLPHLLADGVLIFLAAELVERTLLSSFNGEANARNEHLNKEAEKRNDQLHNDANVRIDQLGARLSEKVETVLVSSLDDAKYAAHYHVHFRPPRRSKSNAQVSYKEIATAIADAEWIKILCTSGRDIFSNEQVVGNALLTRARSAPLDVTVLSCRPIVDGGMYALVRGELEEPGYRNIVSSDTEVALDDFAKLFILSNHETSHFRWYYYDFVPQGWIFLTDKIGFAEMYHFSLDIRKRGIPSFCMGGKVPLLAFSPTAGLYEALKEHISYLCGDIFIENEIAQRHRRDFFKVTEAYDSAYPAHHARVHNRILLPGA